MEYVRWVDNEIRTRPLVAKITMPDLTDFIASLDRFRQTFDAIDGIVDSTATVIDPEIKALPEKKEG